MESTYLRVLPDFCKMHDDREVADTVVDKAASAPMAWETFTLEGVEKPKGHAYIKTSHNNYLAANQNGDMEVVGKAKAGTWSLAATRTTPSLWTTVAAADATT